MSARSSWFAQVDTQNRFRPRFSASGARAIASVRPPKGASSRCRSTIYSYAPRPCVRLAPGQFDEVEILIGCLDVVAQQIVAIAAEEGEAGIGEHELLDIIRRAHNFSKTTETELTHLLKQMASESTSASLERRPRFSTIRGADGLAQNAAREWPQSPQAEPSPKMETTTSSSSRRGARSAMSKKTSRRNRCAATSSPSARNRGECSASRADG